jgi:hypothetical protein
VERVFDWPGEAETLFVSVDVLAGTPQNVVLEVVLNGEIVLHRLADLPSKPIPVHSPKLLVPGVVSVRLGSVSKEKPTMISESQLTRLDTVIRVFGPMESPQKGPMESLRRPSGQNIVRRFVHRVRQRIKHS